MRCKASCIFHRQPWYRALFVRMRKLCVYSTFGHHHPHPYATSVANFVLAPPPIAELARQEKSRTQSLTHSPSVFDSPGTEAFASEKNC